MLVSNCGLVRIFVLRFVIPEACTYGLSLRDEVGAWFIFYCLPYEWRSGMSAGLFLPIYPPRSMRSSTLLRGLLNFCNKYVSSLWLMLSPWNIRTLTLPPLLASLVPRNSRRCIKPTIYPSSKQLPYLPIMAFPVGERSISKKFLQSRKIYLGEA
jgi:hypothetical protein